MMKMEEVIDLLENHLGSLCKKGRYYVMKLIKYQLIETKINKELNSLYPYNPRLKCIVKTHENGFLLRPIFVATDSLFLNF